MIDPTFGATVGNDECHPLRTAVFQGRCNRTKLDSKYKICNGDSQTLSVLDPKLNHVDFATQRVLAPTQKPT
jgi:hypothetical protein